MPDPQFVGTTELDHQQPLFDKLPTEPAAGDSPAHPRPYPRRRLADASSPAPSCTSTAGPRRRRRPPS